MDLGNIKQRLQKAQESPPKALLRWQDEVPKLIERYAIKPPQNLRIWALAKKNYGYIETTVKALEDSLKDKDLKQCGGLLISRLFPKKKL